VAAVRRTAGIRCLWGQVPPSAWGPCTLSLHQGVPHTGGAWQGAWGSAAARARAAHTPSRSVAAVVRGPCALWD